MGVRVHLRDAKSAADVREALAKLGLMLSESQQKFLDEHDGHQGLVIDGRRIYCRTCNKRDGQ